MGSSRIRSLAFPTSARAIATSCLPLADRASTGAVSGNSSCSFSCTALARFRIERWFMNRWLFEAAMSSRRRFSATVMPNTTGIVYVLVNGRNATLLASLGDEIVIASPSTRISPEVSR